MTKSEALEKIAFMGMDAGIHCGDKEYFYRNQLASCISIATRALADQPQSDMVNPISKNAENVSEITKAMEDALIGGLSIMRISQDEFRKTPLINNQLSDVTDINVGDIQEPVVRESRITDRSADAGETIVGGAPTETGYDKFIELWDSEVEFPNNNIRENTPLHFAWWGWQARGQTVKQPFTVESAPTERDRSAFEAWYESKWPTVVELGFLKWSEEKSRYNSIYVNCRWEGFKEATRQALGQVPEWISVDDRLPKPEARVLVCMINGSVKITSWYRGEFIMPSKEQPTHWMNLPAAPKE